MYELPVEINNEKLGIFRGRKHQSQEKRKGRQVYKREHSQKKENIFLMHMKLGGSNMSPKLMSRFEAYSC